VNLKSEERGQRWHEEADWEREEEDEKERALKSSLACFQLYFDSARTLLRSAEN